MVTNVSYNHPLGTKCGKYIGLVLKQVWLSLNFKIIWAILIWNVWKMVLYETARNRFKLEFLEDHFTFYDKQAH